MCMKWLNIHPILNLQTSSFCAETYSRNTHTPTHTCATTCDWLHLQLSDAHACLGPVIPLLDSESDGILCHAAKGVLAAWDEKEMANFGS